MREQEAQGYGSVKQSRFPVRVFWVYFGTLLLMSGFHQGFVVLVTERTWPVILEVGMPAAYWALVAVFLTLYTRYQIKKAYEEPMQKMADATRRVASGDFTVYVPTIHTQEKYDYLDVMIRDFNKMVEELGSVETLKTDFFSNVSHEIKAPLAVIHSNVELLENGGKTVEQQEEYILNIRRATMRLADLISNMLKLNKLEKQAIKPSPQRYDLCRQLCDCALQFEMVWERKDIEFDADIEERAYIEADAGLLELVWNNLLSNAFKFTPDGGCVRILQKRIGDRQQITISDTGCGMDAETAKRIFEKFYQGDTSHATEGNGLGLALVKRILELSEGSIRVESEPGRGSRFVVEFPAAESISEGDENSDHE